MIVRFCVGARDRFDDHREDFPYWLKRASGAAALRAAGPRAPGMRRWRAGPCAHPTVLARNAEGHPAT